MSIHCLFIYSIFRDCISMLSNVRADIIVVLKNLDLEMFFTLYTSANISRFVV